MESDMTNPARTKLDNLQLAGLDPQDQIAPNFRVCEDRVD